MPANIQVVLQQDVDNVGKRGELVKVRPGFARNYLLPRAARRPGDDRRGATASTHEKAVAVAQAEKAKKEARERRRRRSTRSTITIARPVGEDDKLFGSVTAKDIENAVKAARASSTIDRKKMHLAEPHQERSAPSRSR